METTSQKQQSTNLPRPNAPPNAPVSCCFPRFGSILSDSNKPLSHELEIKKTKELQAFLATDGAEAPFLLQTLWALVLRCYTAQNDVCFAYEETVDSDFVGLPFVRLVFDEAASLASTIKKARNDYMGALDSNTIHPPTESLCNTILSVTRSTDNPPRELDNPCDEQFDIRLNAQVSDGSIKLSIHSWSHVHSQDSLMNIFSTIETVLSSLLCEASAILVADLIYLSDHNQSQLRDMNSGDLEYVDKCIHEVILDQALLHPNSEAVCFDDGTTISYETLDSLSSRLAIYLHTLGIGRGDFVPLCMSKDPSYVVSMLAVMKAAAAFVPLDPAAPVARLKSLCKNVQASVLLCSPQHAGMLLSIVDNVIPVDGSMIDQLPESMPTDRLPIKSTDLAYLIFTSGTTGEPKGTMIEHGSYCSGAKAHAPAMRLSSKSRVLQFASHVFDASLVEILTTLMVGGVVCIPSEEHRLNNLTKSMANMGVNWAVLTPSFASFMDPAELPELQTLVLAGEAMSASHVATWNHIDLVNGYGPSECSVASVVNSKVTPETSPSNIGRPTGVHAWVVDPENHDKLLPIGCVGELLIEGPPVARGYHNDVVKTEASFISAPAWASKFGSSHSKWRMYKTGDLVRVETDGTLAFVGRKDTQVKVHGQRVELGEIEHQFAVDSEVKHSLVLLPKSGPFHGRLIAILSLKSAPPGDACLQIVEGAAVEVESIRERLSSKLPIYMVPAVLLVVTDLPMLPSGKLDRKQTKSWVEGMDNDLYQRVIDVAEPINNSVPSNGTPASEIEHKLRTIWGHVLNLRSDNIELNRSFMSLGGDSISAMQVKGQCSKQGISLSVQDILRSKSIVQLAQCAKAIEHQAYREEVIEQDFSLSPIQSLFFKLPNQGKGHFNQSFFLNVTRTIHKKDLRNALETVVQRHSMLRARFRAGLNGDWQQRITDEVSTSYCLKTYRIFQAKQANWAIAESQTSLNFEQGPLFAADLFEVEGQGQLLFMVAHHLVIDLVSWRVILEEIEEILSHPEKSAMEKPVSFQTWCHMQFEDCQTTIMNKVLPVDDIPPGDASYWGMLDVPNTYGDVACEGFEIDKATTSMVLTECHETLHTEPVDILLSALISSFAIAFPDRTVPAIYNEGHGREPSDMPVDITRTIGWFTTMFPVHIPEPATKSPIDTIKHVKDYRRKVPDNGRPYFASRCLTTEGDQRFGHHWPLEITFNYLGQYQQLEREGALLRPVDAMAGETRGAGGTADVGNDTPRFGLFEISAVVVQGRLRFAFTFNRRMLHQQKIAQWLVHCQRMLGTMTTALIRMTPVPTLGDFPLLSLTYQDLDKLITERLPQSGISNIRNVQEVYPCSSMQEGLLISQTKSSAFYAVQVVSELKVARGVPLDTNVLANAWQLVVDRHPCLRTVFIESIGDDDGLYDQVVLKSVVADTTFITCDDEEEALKLLSEKQPPRYIDSEHPPHQLSICKTRGRIFSRLSISHTIMDGGSMSIIFQDLAAAYQGLLPKGSGPLYSDYISYLQKQPYEASLEYWRMYLNNVEPCTFPVLNDGRSITKALKSFRLDFTSSHFLKVQKFCDTNGLTFSNVLHTAWGLTLRAYTSSDDVVFGYLTSGRDAPIKGIEDAVGPFINMLVCRVSTAPASRLGAILDQVQKDYVDSLPHRNISLAEVQHALQISGAPLFNTALSYRRLPKKQSANAGNVTFVECVPTYDPTEYNLSINIETSDDNAAIDLDYWTDYISDGQAANVGSLFLHCLDNIVHYSDSTIAHLNNLSEHHLGQVQKWNSNMPETINDCVHRVIQGQMHLRPEAAAVCAWDVEFTYSELDQLSSKLAHYIAGMNIGPETFVPTCFDKSGWAICAMLAVLKSGGAAVPLDATHPRSALKLRVQDTQAKVILASPSRAEIFEDMGVYVVPVSKELLTQLPAFPEDPCPSVQPLSPCFIIYTSGSTGKPKGVVLEHRAIVTSSHATGTAYDWGQQTRCLQFAAYTFDNSLAEMFFTLMRGGCVCVPSEHERFNDLAGAINRFNVNFMDITPTVASFLRPSDVPSVKGLSLGGEPLTKDNIDIWGEAVSLHCCYGPSECSVNSTWNGNLGNSSEATNIGKSIGSISWIVDPENHNYLTPIGCIGELLIEGPILAREYLHDPDKTSKAFIFGPLWAGDETRRFYKTGDLARLNSDGTITYLGRKDTQIKLNGQRIEVGEIEHHLKSNLDAEVQSAVELITMSEHQKASKFLAAFFCLLPEESTPCQEPGNFLLPMSDAIREISSKLETALGATLPAYMVPSMFLPVSEMPMTSSGKLDRRTLRTACHRLSEEQAAMYRLAQKSGRPPTTAIERLIAELWESVLNISKGSVGVDDNFFRIGGDSIGAMKLITAARAKGVSLTVANIFQHPILSELSTNAVNSSSTERFDAVPYELKPFSMLNNDCKARDIIAEVASECRADVESIQDIYPCTRIQEGLIALSNKDPGAYVAQNIYQLPANIDSDRFCEAWQKVAQTEAILRTRVVHTKRSGFLQVVLQEPIVWNRATNLQAIVDEDRKLPAYNGGPLASYTMVEEIGQNLHFVWTAHHAIYDGWSLPLMLERVEACYNLEPLNTTSAMAYPRFIKYLTDTDPTESDNFWKFKLSETTAVTFPPLPNPTYQVHATSTAKRRASLARVAGTNVTLASTVRAAWALVVATYSGNSGDVVFGETLTGRDAPIDDIEGMIGPTLATVPTRIRINPATTIGRFIEDVQTLSAEAIPFQYAGLQHIKHLNEDTATACGFQNLLAVHHETKELSSGFWHLLSSGTVGTNFYSYPLTVSCQLGEESVEIEAHYDANVISTWLVEKLLTQFDFTLQCLIPPHMMGKKLGEIQFLNAEDEAMISSWNSDPIRVVNECVHQMIHKITREQSDAIAIDSWDGILTYRELDRLSTKLAQHLIELKVQNTLVPLCFEKSAWTIVAMLGVLKAGNAFVPLDPTAPPARLRDILGDIESCAILCSAKYHELCSKLAPRAIIVESKRIENLSFRGTVLPRGDPNSPAYLIFTSGSTGKPKGTIIQHSAFCSGAAAHGPALRILPSSRVLQFASYTFDASLLEILTTLIIGGTICVPSDEDRLNNIAGVITDMKVSWTLLTPSFIQLVQPSSIPTLRTLVLGGENMSQSHLTTWADKLELINAYGPSECAVVATANPHMSMRTDPNNMGRAVGGRSWITDINNPHRLVPIGSVGELVVEGPILAQGYLKNEVKTAEVFIENPSWACDSTSPDAIRRRMYRTGDKVKYASDGSLVFCGRADNQVKLHGQRLELSEIEHHLRTDPSVQHVLATIPKDGFCKKRLVVVLSLQELAATNTTTSGFQVVVREASSFYLSGIRDRLCEHLPAYMIPSNWVVVHKLPLLPSGKLDRKKIEQWIEDMSSETYHQISDINRNETKADITTVEEQLRQIWGKALNLPPHQIGIHQSFLHLGGDSISAMQVMSSCRSAGLGVTVQDIIRSKSISQLALCVTLPEEVSNAPELVDEAFGLSPIQSLFFECVGDKWAHFNQSVMLRLAKFVDADVIRHAIQNLVNCHSMLRANFFKDSLGIWQQRIHPETSSSHAFKCRAIGRDQLSALIRECQENLNIENGPLFAVNLLSVDGEPTQLLLIVAHHLIIDVVSWRIILQDLEDILGPGQSKLDNSLSFQTWSRVQFDNAQNHVLQSPILKEAPVADFKYWGMENKSNTYGDTTEAGFEIDADTSLVLLGACHKSMQTEPVDVFLAAVLQSFQKVFPDRLQMPAIYNEGHGREPGPNSKLDLSRTVGWFTTMCPVFLPTSTDVEPDLLNTIRWVKDLRRRIPDKGRPYFAQRMLTAKGKEQYSGHWPMEITFNYLGKLQQLERTDSILQPVDNNAHADWDIGQDVPRFALFEISASVTHGNIKIGFSYNKNMKRQAKIRRWANIECKRMLEDAAKRLVQLKSEQTLCSFPLLPLAYNGIVQLVEKLPLLGVRSLEEIEDVYPTSPIQQGMLLAQLKNPELYAYVAIFEVSGADSREVDARYLAEAWQAVVRRHATLRTVFIDSICQKGRNDQVVLKDKIARIAWLECEDANVLETLAQQTPINFHDLQPPHRFTLCKTDHQKVFAKIELSHVISDGTSVPILFKDLAVAYKECISKSDSSAASKPESPQIAPLYSEYIAHIQSRSPDEDVNYWKAYLAGIEPCHLTSLHDGIKKDKELRSLVLKLSRTPDLKAFCSKNGVTLSNVLQFTWALILRAYSGSDEVCFGYLTSGRDAPITGLQDAGVGAFINMLTCRINLNPSLQIGKALHQIQSDYMNSMLHQSCSLADVQHELQLSSTSLFNTAFTFQNRTHTKASSDSFITFDILEAHDPSEYDVTVNVEALDTGVEIHFGYWTTTLSDAQANNVSNTFEHLVNTIISQQKIDQTIANLNFLSVDSHRQIVKWNASLPKEVDRCFHDMVRDQSLGRLGTKPAICAWNGNFTYQEIDELATALACHLVELGVGPEVFVPLCFEKSAFNVIAMLACGKAGGSFVPLDFSHPQGRLKHFIDDVQADLVLCSRQNLEKVSGAAKHTFVVDLESIKNLKYTTKTLNLPQVSPDNAAYIIFTSGTTGRPKGTIVEHAAFCTSAIEHSKAMCMKSSSRVFQFASHTFDASVMEILTTLIVGGCVCIPSEEDRMNDIPGAIQRMGVTWTLLTPSVASTLSPKSVPSLKVLVTGGEAMSSGHLARWRATCCLINAYGPSEAAVIASASIKVDEASNELNADPSNIGRGVGGRTWIVDPQNYNKLVPVGGIGELVVEGRIVARGYLNNNEKTASVFINNPSFLDVMEKSERIYRTGDLVRYNSDGTLSFVARKDTQIKLNGQRIELGEIEHNVKAMLPENSQSAVELVAPMSRIATKALAVFFSFAGSQSTAPEDDRISGVDEILLPMTDIAKNMAKNLDSSLAAILPSYMIPSFYVPVTKMPWMSSGKMDRARLRNIVQNLPKEMTGPYRLAGTETSTTTKAPTTAAEKKLQKLWETVLNISNPGSVGIEDSFFRLGGDSVTAMKLVGAARSEGISLSVIDIFRNPRLYDMAQICGTVEEGRQVDLEPFSLLTEEPVDSIIDELVEQCRVKREMLADAYRCSLLQEGLVTLSMKQSGAYVAQNVFKLPKNLDMDRFKAVWQQTVHDVDILRTRIVHMKSAVFLQAVIRDEAIDWHTASSLAEIESEGARIPEHNGGPLTRYTIVSEGDCQYFVWSIHHALYDGWSLPMVLSRVEMAYRDASTNLPKSSYALFIKYLSDVDEPASDEFWRTKLVGSSPLQFPQTQHTSTERARNNQIMSHTASISRNTASMGITVPTIIRAAWSMVAAAYSGSNDVVFGETLAGRDIPVQGIADIIGPTFTTVPTRIQVNKTQTATKFLEEIQKMASDVIPYQHAGLQRIKRLDSDTELACDFQNLLVIQTAEEQIEDGLWDLQGSGVAANFFTYPLVLECRGSSDKVEITAHYDDQCLSPWRVQRLLYQLDAVLQQLSDLPKLGSSTTLNMVEVFSTQDQQLVQAWNCKVPEFVNACIHEEFEEMALSQPHAPAVCAWDGELTYDGLQAHSLALARYLVALGAGPETFIPICMDKSMWVIPTMLGILMSGSAFVPLDPASPSIRHQEMIKDVDATIIVCSPQHAKRFKGAVRNIVSLDEALINGLPQPSPQDGSSAVTSLNAAYVIFTSGSTGRPKGTLVEHRAISTSSVAMREVLLMKPTSRVFQFASFTFDVSVLEILTTLTCGGCICIPSEDLRTRNVAEAINSLHATWAFLTPSVANLLEPDSTPSLEVLVCGGESMSIENVLKWASKLTLVNGYGPTEASVIAIANPSVSAQRDPTNIGRALPSGRVWIADPQDHNQITPVGCVGELLLDGPFLAREYIKNKAKTDEAFVARPKWANLFDQQSSKMYRTGDLVQYNPDGSLIFIGRKDNQVKLHGQRLELGEIEHALDKDHQIQHALVALPKAGPFRKRLVAVVSLTELATIALAKGDCILIKDGPRAATSRCIVSSARIRLSDILPPYMVPTSWLVVESIPLLPSGKLDRRSVDTWLQSIDEETYEKILEAEDEDDNSITATETSTLLQQIFSKVLNLPLQRVKLSKSFLSLGGDSITAMQVMALCRKEKINFSLSEVLRSKSIHQLALNARFGDEVQHQEEVFDQTFELSPIQQLYFGSQPNPVYEGTGRFNQSFSLEVTKYIEPHDIHLAVQRIVEQHSMLRARFTKTSSGTWKQVLTRDATSSYSYKSHQLKNADQIPSLVGCTQSSLNIQKGPLFAIDLFNLPDKQMIFLAAHHLIIDMVSWRIILGDLEDLLNKKSLVADKPLSFQVWCAMQAEQSLKEASTNANNFLPFKLPPSDLQYWGMEERANTYGDVISQSFTVEQNISALALGQCNNPFRTEPIELFLSAIMHSFSRVFVDRATPAIFNEGHGREPWDSNIDVSRTVGWFTTIFPVHVEIEPDADDVVETVQRMKDTRRRMPGNGRPYFAHRFLTPSGQLDSKNQPMEIIFNYLGRMQQLEHDDSLLQQWDYGEDEETSKTIADVGSKASRFALFEISAAVVRDKVQFSFLYNSKMKHQQDIQRWVHECQETFEELVERLAAITGESSFTLSDFPLLPISYDGLQKIVTRSLPQVGITPAQVEDIYPCAPLQEGLLISQLKNPSLYHFHAVFEVHPAAHDGALVDGQRLAQAWQKVVDRHGALRTVFADSVYKGDIFNQIVVKQVDSGVITVWCEGGEEEAIEKLKNMTILDANYTKQPRLPHQAIICKTSSGKVYFKAEVNHAVIDGSSANIMLRDLAAAYHGRLPDGLGPLYSDYVSYIKSQPGGVGIKFWKTYLEGARACHFPVLTKTSDRRLGSVAMNFGRFPELQEMCRKMNVTLANVMQSAWAFVLRHFCKSEDICFGYLTSGRDVPVNGIQNTIGAFINMLVCRVKFTKQSTLKEIFQKVQNDFLQSLEHQHCSLAQVQHDLMGGKALFNTAVSIQSDGPSDGTESTSISFDPVAAHDPSEYLVTLNIRTLRNDEGIVIRYWTDIMTEEEAQGLSDMLARVMETFINKPHQLVEELDLAKVEEEEQKTELPASAGVIEEPQLYTSETQLRTVINECVREIIDQLFKSGALISQDQQKVNNTIQIATQQPIQPMVDYSQMSDLPRRPQFERTKSASTVASRRLAQLSRVEQKLLSVWSELLQISEDSIKKDDSFFQLGGDSIIAMQMVGMARDEDLALTVANIFRNPTFADMAAVIRMAEEGQISRDAGTSQDYVEAHEARSQAIQNALYQRYSLLEAANVDAFLQDNICPRVRSFRGGIVDVFPVTDFQALAVTGTLMESKWMLNYFYLEGDGTLDLKRLKSTIYKLVESFDILRTVFVPYGSRFFQVVLRKLQPNVSVYETENLAEFTTTLQQRDRESGPALGESYLQFTIAKQKGSSAHRIIMRMSHAQYDGVCLPSILGALQAGYKGHSIPPTPAFSTYVRDAARSTTDDHYVYWKDLLKGSFMTEIVRRRGPNYSRGTDAPTVLKRVVNISSLAADNITPATIIKAAWSLVLAKWTARSDIVFGNVISGRNAAVLGVESIIGPCVNLIPVRVNIQEGWSVLDLLRSVQDQQVAAMPYESLGFREIIKHCTSWPDWTNFSTVCQHQNIERQGEIQIGGTAYTLGAVGSQEDFADLTVLSTPQPDDQIEISLIFTSSSGITLGFAQEMFESLVDTAVEFSANATYPLPAPAKLCALDSKALHEEEIEVDKELSSNLQVLNRDELLAYSDVVTRAWKQILWDRNGAKLDLESSFYELGGDIIGLAQVAFLLEQEGYKLRVEDLVDHPVMIEQLALLAVFDKEKREREAAEVSETGAQALATPKKGLKKIFGKPIGLARRFRQRKGEPQD